MGPERLSKAQIDSLKHQIEWDGRKGRQFCSVDREQLQSLVIEIEQGREQTMLAPYYQDSVVTIYHRNRKEILRHLESVEDLNSEISFLRQSNQTRLDTIEALGKQNTERFEQLRRIEMILTNDGYESRDTVVEMFDDFHTMTLKVQQSAVNLYHQVKELEGQLEAEQLRTHAYLAYDTTYSDDFCIKCSHEPTNCECDSPVYMEGWLPTYRLSTIKREISSLHEQLTAAQAEIHRLKGK